MKKHILIIFLAMLTLVGCSEEESKNKDKEMIVNQNNKINKNQHNNKKENDDWYGEGDLDDKVDDSHLSKEEQAKNRQIGSLEDGRYEIEVVYPYEDRLRFNVLYKFVDKDKQIKDGGGQVFDAGKMLENDNNALTLKFDVALQNKVAVRRHGLFIIEVHNNTITSVTN